MLKINDDLSIPESELELSAIRAQGPGGQNVNKVASAIHLRFDIANSAALSDDVKERLLALKDRRISKAGVVVIKSQRFRNQDPRETGRPGTKSTSGEEAAEENKTFEASPGTAARRKVATFTPQKPRKKTKPSKQARERRLEEKSRRSRLKQSRKPVED
jgi:ribosome-associated protein